MRSSLNDDIRRMHHACPFCTTISLNAPRLLAMHQALSKNAPRKQEMHQDFSEMQQGNKDKYIYSAKHADAAVTRRRSESRQGIRVTEEQMAGMNSLITQLVKKGQPLAHIYAEHEEEIPVSLRTLYNYIDAGEMSVKSIDLRRKTGYRPRKKKAAKSLGFANLEFRKARTYAGCPGYLGHR